MTTIQQQIREVEREIQRRKRQYPKLVENGDIKKSEAETAIKTMEDVRNSLLLMPKEASLLAL